MGHAGHLVGFTVAKQAVEAGVSIRMSPAFATCEVADRMFALAIDGELVPGAGGGLSRPGAFIADIGPDPGRFGLLLAWCLHLQLVAGPRAIVAGCKNFLMPVEMIGKRLAAVPGRCFVCSSWRLRVLCRCGLCNCLIFFEGQIELIPALGAYIKSVAVWARQLVLELLGQKGLLQGLNAEVGSQRAGLWGHPG